MAQQAQGLDAVRLGQVPLVELLPGLLVFGFVLVLELVLVFRLNCLLAS